jgi:hypothetical protein
MNAQAQAVVVVVVVVVVVPFISAFFGRQKDRTNLRVIRNDGIVCVLALLTFNGEGFIEGEEVAHDSLYFSL